MPESNTIIHGDCLSVLRTWPDAFVQCIVTSPPYFGLRNYGTSPVIFGNHNNCQHEWSEVVKPAANGIINGGMQGETLSGNSGTRKPTSSERCVVCGAWQGHLGLELTLTEYIEHMVEIFRECRRVLRPDGVFWLNVGDSYSGSGFGCANYPDPNDKQSTNRGHATQVGLGRASAVGFRPKNLMLVPARLAIALQEDGWWVRSRVIWDKPNGMTESVEDRPTKSDEDIYLLTRSEKYYYDWEAISEKCTSGPSDIKKMTEKRDRIGGKTLSNEDALNKGNKNTAIGRKRAVGDPEKRNKRSVWRVATVPYREAHFATFPPKLIKPMILAGSKPGDIVLDPFMGAGTVALVAKEFNRRYLGIELNPEYIKMAERRLRQEVLEFA